METPATIPGDLVERHVIPALADAGLLTPGADTHVVSQPPTRARSGVDLVHVPEEPAGARPPVDAGPPQVHVTIGRVTVVRAGPPVPPEPPRPPRAAGADHQAYLARRRQEP